MLEATDVQMPDYVPPLVASASTERSMYVVGSLVFRLIVYKAVQIFGRYKEHTTTPYRFLNRIRHAGATMRVQPV
jgi:hypothetical protein